MYYASMKHMLKVINNMFPKVVGLCSEPHAQGARMLETMFKAMSPPMF